MSYQPTQSSFWNEKTEEGVHDSGEVVTAAEEYRDTSKIYEAVQDNPNPLNIRMYKPIDMKRLEAQSLKSYRDTIEISSNK